eukprot:TRINITY_DN8169_c3_g1_i1.p1 TRINITY_DN8169_c3_g1~~TRINITY_DN8169_c3_g1_i1.p1  ORF type:complete len:262 (+),score=77.53 TRINITY_DN8169_c3_g1_i1:90-788(+)
MADPVVTEVAETRAADAEDAVEVAGVRPEGEAAAAEGQGEGEGEQRELTPEEQQALMRHRMMLQQRATQERLQKMGVVQKDFQTIYPHYIDKGLSVKQGRRVAKEKAVNHPHIMEILQICSRLGFVCFAENKGFPRELNASPGPDQHGRKCHRGRVRVLLKRPLPKDEGGKVADKDAARELEVEEFPTKDSLLKKLCEIFPLLPSRQAPPPQAVQAPTVNTSTKKKDKKKKK